MANTRKVKMLIPRGSPTDGAMLQRGATVELPEYWADRFVEDETAEEVSEQKASKTEKPKAKKTKKGS